MDDRRTKESQYQELLRIAEKTGLSRLGLSANATWELDPKRLVFMLSRYKFVAKMLSGKESVLEVGCGDGFGSRIVRQEVTHLTAVDFDPIFIDDANSTPSETWPIDFRTHDILSSPVVGGYKAAYSLDVIEHINLADENDYMANIAASLADHGTAIIGTPSLESQAYASEISKQGHVNCKTADKMKSLAAKYFHNVFIFSMNDEVIHTGFAPMAHYLIALCVDPKDR